eukprot:7876343-Karenia_brevis.AAC.1
MAWCMLAKSAAHALAYDARLVPSEALASVSGPVSQKLIAAIQALCGGVLDENAILQMQLTGIYGGLGVRLLAQGLAADAAYYATWVTQAN